ncbi:hypothetical protein [Sphingobacterium lumbrici]|uniref:hypothetical protein n=1 Tax=Sphingobacterium lumbrici TaxID=2559600 RepID=UPI0011298956|nr:hypothetical protein [Sphingobacterium lumbrici]
MNISHILCLTALLCFGTCQTKAKNQIGLESVSVLTPDSIPSIVHLEDTVLMESSGLAFSQYHNGILYTHEDSKCENKITVFDLQGKTKARIWLKGVENRDWEDIAVIAHPSGSSYIYLADIGDNAQKYAEVYLYRFEEPKQLEIDMEVEVERISFQYPSGPLNAETLFFDPIDNGLWIVSKEKENCGLYRLPFDITSVAADTLLLAEKMGTLPLERVTAGDISRDGRFVMLRTKPGIYLWERKAKESLPMLMSQQPTLIKHRPEHQSEGIAIAPDGSGFVTSTEIQKKSGLKPYISIYRW